MSDSVIIPKNEIEKIEEARAMLWDFTDNLNLSPLKMFELEKITSILYNFSNRKWEESE